MNPQCRGASPRPRLSVYLKTGRAAGSVKGPALRLHRLLPDTPYIYPYMPRTDTSPEATASRVPSG